MKGKEAKGKREIGAIIKDVGSSVRTKTGSWRTFKPVVGGCKACGICPKFCPEGAIEIINKKAAIDYDYCKGCAICANVCPFKAIKMEREYK